MKTWLRPLLPLVLLAPAAAQGSVTVDVGRGPVTIFVPAGYDPAQPAPLVMLLHGYTASGPAQEAYMQFRPLQDQYGFLYLHPNGTLDAFGNRFWNATDACCDFGSSGVDDSAYLRALIDEVRNVLSVDARRVYLIGHSNGGFMSYRMACDHADTIAAIASLAGASWFDPAACAPAAPVHVLQIHGTADTTIRFNGGTIQGNAYPGAVGSVERWATYDGCSLAGQTLPGALDLDASVPGAETIVTRYDSGCDSGGSGELWRIQSGGHVPNLTQDFRHLVIEHLLAHSAPGIDPVRYCSPAQPTSTGQPARIDATGSDVVVDDDLTLVADDLPPNQFGYFLVSRTAGLLQPPGSQGELCLADDIGRYASAVQSSGPGGEFELAIAMGAIPVNPPVAAAPGETWRFQAWFRDMNPGPTSNFTDAVAVELR